MSRAHYSDEQTLALLDGETPRWKAWRMRRHLELCWECRRRSLEIAEGAAEISRVFGEGAWLPREMAARSREALLRRLEGEIPESKSGRSFPRPVWAVAASVAACVVVAFAMPAIRSISLARHARESVSRLLPAPPPSPHVQPPKISLLPPTLIRPAPVLPAPPKLEMQTSALLEAFWTAHQLDACTEEQIEIQTRGSTVWIKGVASSPGRRRVLEDALRASGTGVQIEIRLPGSAAPPPLGNRIQVIERKMQPSAIPIQAELAAYLHDPAGEAVRSFAHSVVTASEKSAVHAWALRQLATAFPEPVAGRLNPSERLRLQSMLTAHLAALGDSQDELREKLYPLLGTSSQVVGQADTGSWQSSVLAVCASAEASHRRVYRLFTIGSKDEEPIGESREALAAALGAGISARKAAVRWASDIGSPTTAGNLNP